MMSFPGSHSEPIKKWKEAAWSHKNTLREKPQGVFGVHYYLLAGYARSRRCSRPPLLAPAAARSLAPVAELATQCSTQLRGALVDTSVYLKPTKLLDVALDVLAGLAPCLNLRVGELGHKDLLDTIGSDNCRK